MQIFTRPILKVADLSILHSSATVQLKFLVSKVTGPSKKCWVGRSRKTASQGTRIADPGINEQRTWMSSWSSWCRFSSGWYLKFDQAVLDNDAQSPPMTHPFWRHHQSAINVKSLVASGATRGQLTSLPWGIDMIGLRAHVRQLWTKFIVLAPLPWLWQFSISTAHQLADLTWLAGWSRFGLKPRGSPKGEGKTLSKRWDTWKVEDIWKQVETRLTRGRNFNWASARYQDREKF